MARIAEVGLGPTAVMGADEPDGIATNLIWSAAPNLVSISRCPSLPLRTLLAESGAPLAISFDDPREGLFEVVAGHGHDLYTGIKLVAGSCAGAMVCAAMPRALVIRGDQARKDPAGVIAHLAQLCGVDAPVDRFDIAPPPDPSPAAQEWWDGLDPDGRAIAAGALDAYSAWLPGAGLGEIIWDRRLFTCATDRTRNAGSAIEIGDAPQRLADGPWIGLPPGNWAASVTLAVSRDINGARFDVGIHANHQPGLLAQASIVPDGRGLGSATLLFTIAPTCGETIAFTISSAVPAPGGRLALGNVVLTSGPGEGTGIPAELSSALSL